VQLGLGDEMFFNRGRERLKAREKKKEKTKQQDGFSNINHKNFKIFKTIIVVTYLSILIYSNSIIKFHFSINPCLNLPCSICVFEQQ